jgi:predicted dehydrogenase
MRTLARNVVIVGLGIAGKTHIRALEQIPSLNVLAGVDTKSSRKLTFRGCAMPIYRRLIDAANRFDPHVVVVATPTATHPAVCDEAAERFPNATILVEKPVADNLPAARQLLSERKQKVHAALHMAFSPEVSWGTRIAQERASDFGRALGIQSLSTDAYQSDRASAERRLGNSWVDGGINALSVIDRFVKVVDRRSLRRLGPPANSEFEGVFVCEDSGRQLEALILTSWNGADAARATRVRYESGAELVMDHHAVTGYLVEDGRIAAVFSDGDSVPRRERHYQALYRSWLVDGNEISAEAGVRLHELLLRESAAVGPAARVGE